MKPNTIAYREPNKIGIPVYLAGKKIGHIIHDGEIYYYKTLDGHKGEPFLSVKSVKDSLESNVLQFIYNYFLYF